MGSGVEAKYVYAKICRPLRTKCRNTNGHKTERKQSHFTYNLSCKTVKVRGNMHGCYAAQSCRNLLKRTQAGAVAAEV